MPKGQWSRWGRGLCEGYSIELGEVYKGSVVRRDDEVGKPKFYEAQVNKHTLPPFQDKESAMRAVEFEIEQGMKRLNEDWAVYQATKLLGIKKGKRKLGLS